MSARGVFLIVLTVAAGCALFKAHPPPPPAVREYHARGFDWNGVARVLLLPLVNESPFPRAAEEVRSALAAEFQSLGRFEVVSSPCGPDGELVGPARLGGRFDEAALLDLARAARAEVIVLGTLTQYHPYPPPRVGLSLQAISPFDAAAVASVDGLWDAAVKSTADLACAFYREGLRHSQTWASSELALDSPRLYQRFVAGQAVQILTGQNVPAPLPGTAGVPQTGPAKQPLKSEP